MNLTRKYIIYGGVLLISLATITGVIIAQPNLRATDDVGSGDGVVACPPVQKLIDDNTRAANTTNDIQVAELMKRATKLNVELKYIDSQFKSDWDLYSKLGARAQINSYARGAFEVITILKGGPASEAQMTLLKNNIANYYVAKMNDPVMALKLYMGILKPEGLLEQTNWLGIVNSSFPDSRILGRDTVAVAPEPTTRSWKYSIDGGLNFKDKIPMPSNVTLNSIDVGLRASFSSRAEGKFCYSIILPGIASADLSNAFNNIKLSGYWVDPKNNSGLFFDVTATEKLRISSFAAGYTIRW